MSVKEAPEYQHIKTVVSADESTPPSELKKGVNFKGYDIGIIQIIPSAGSTPTVELLAWCPSQDTFIPVEPAATWTAPAAGEAFEFTFSPYGRSVWLRVTNVGGGSETVEVWASAHAVGKF